MIKLNNSSKKFLKIAVTMSVFSLPSLGLADDASNTQLLEEIGGNVNKIVNDSTYSSSKTSQKSRQDLEVLFNTSWELSYSIDGVPQTSKLDLSDKTETADGSEGVIGSFFRDANGGDGDSVACMFVADVEPDLVDILGIDYLCAVSQGSHLVSEFQVTV